MLLRHAKSAWPDVPDHERPLARRGKRDAPVMGRWLHTAGHLPDQVLCSPARRARETWQLAQAGLGSTPPVTFDDGLYHASAADILELIRQTSPAVTTLLIVGHDPAITELTLTLARSRSDAAPDETVNRIKAKFPTAAIAILEFAGGWDQLGGGSARLTGFVTPREVRASASEAAGGP